MPAADTCFWWLLSAQSCSSCPDPKSPALTTHIPQKRLNSHLNLPSVLPNPSTEKQRFYIFQPTMAPWKIGKGSSIPPKGISVEVFSMPSQPSQDVQMPAFSNEQSARPGAWNSPTHCCHTAAFSPSPWPEPDLKPTPIPNHLRHETQGLTDSNTEPTWQRSF